MIRCGAARRWITLALAEDLSERRRKLLATHLAGCGPCRASAREDAELLRALGAPSPPEPGPAYWESFPGRVRERIRSLPPAAAAPPAASRQEHHCRLALAAAVILAVGLGVHEARRPARRQGAAAILVQALRQPGLAGLVEPATLDVEDPGLEIEEFLSEMDRGEARSLRSRLEREIGSDRLPPEGDEDES